MRAEHGVRGGSADCNGRAGRDFVPTYVNWGRYDPFSYVGVAGANNFVSATPTGPCDTSLPLKT